MRNGIRTLTLVSVASQRHWLKGKIFSVYSRGLGALEAASFCLALRAPPTTIHASGSCGSELEVIHMELPQSEISWWTCEPVPGLCLFP